MSTYLWEVPCSRKQHTCTGVQTKNESVKFHFQYVRVIQLTELRSSSSLKLILKREKRAILPILFVEMKTNGNQNEIELPSKTRWYRMRLRFARFPYTTQTRPRTRACVYSAGLRNAEHLLRWSRFSIAHIWCGYVTSTHVDVSVIVWFTPKQNFVQK